MAASLQDHQSQQAYRPPPPSSTVGVSCAPTAAAMRRISVEQWEDTQMQMDSIPGQPMVVDLCGSSPPSKPHPVSEDSSYIDVDAEQGSTRRARDQSKEQTPEDQSHGYKLRDRTKIVRPSNTAQTLFEMGRYTRTEKTYGTRGNRSRGRYGSRRGRRLQRGSSWNMVRSLLFWIGSCCAHIEGRC